MFHFFLSCLIQKVAHFKKINTSRICLQANAVSQFFCGFLVYIPTSEVSSCIVCVFIRIFVDSIQKLVLIRFIVCSKSFIETLNVNSNIFCVSCHSVLSRIKYWMQFTLYDDVH